MSSAELVNGGGGGEDRAEAAESHVVVELVSASAGDSSSSDSISEDQMAPLLAQAEKPKINIFSAPYPRRKRSREQVTRVAETETSPFIQFFMWAWSGSRYSGLLCMALSSVVYCIMEVLSDIFSVQSVPLFEITSTRCIIISVLSFLWLRRSGQPMLGPTNVRNLLVLRALTGCLSLLSFIYCIQRLPLSQAIILSFTAPIMASLAARIILHENLKIAEVGGGLGKVEEARDLYVKGIHHIYAVLIGLFSSITGGISYCLIRAGAKASDQPVVTVFSFGIFASPASIICTFAFEDFVLPGFYSFFLMVVLGALAFFAEVLLARGLQLEKTSKVSNIQYIEAALSQIWGMASSRIVPSFGRFIGCSLIIISACCTMYIGPEKDTE
ncbi:uncharacterized protein LOC127792014 isoform X2 [Diospyros lotus]|uniref:uncharacterized protein LOC127792014 isoform X2 n=1 Tax=Diospyros lotus TaxID=55363 RepID=UPI00225597C1|nr:uncharacterized protein LOC127792014 isoform X2 [Diospyros lotus]